MSLNDQLAKMANLAVRTGVGLLPGQELIISADVEQAPFVRMLTVEAYKAGAKSIFVRYSDEGSALAKFEYGTEEAIAYSPQWLADALADVLDRGGAFLAISSSNPALLESVAPEKVAIASKAQAKAGKKMSEVITSSRANWCIVPYASEAWAKKVFPNDSPEQAIAKLWDAIFATTCVATDDPAANWSAHCDALDRRSRALNDRRFDAIRFRGPGTDLRVGLVQDHLWAAARSTAPNGSVFTANVPTEEVFTMPHRGRVDGFVTSTKPLSLRGNLLDGISVEFKEGRVVNASAKAGEEVLKSLLDTDAGARSLGEVALVPHSSAVSRTNLLYYNTLFDENAASHIALGQAYGENLAGSESLTDEAKAAVGMNESMIHVDWMIGSSEVDVDGLTASGEEIPLMRAGEFVGAFA
jgi:aminopeptidase